MPDKYSRAEEKYIEIVGLLKEMSVIAAGKLSKGKYVEMLGHLDAIIQGILLYVAFENGELSQNEKEFIQGITVNGDILKPLNTAGHRKLFKKWVLITWDNIGESDVPMDYKIVILKDTIVEEVTELANPMAKLDFDIKSKNYIEEIAARMPSLIKAVCLADDEDPEKDELRARIGRGVQLFDDIVKSIWNDEKYSVSQRYF